MMGKNTLKEEGIRKCWGCWWHEKELNAHGENCSISLSKPEHMLNWATERTCKSICCSFISCILCWVYFESNYYLLGGRAGGSHL
jgi:hypothetical protein